MNGEVLNKDNCNLNRYDELNQRIYNRNIPSSYLDAKFSPRPVSTKYSLLPVVDQYKNSNVPIISSVPYNIGKIFNPGNASGPWSGFATNVDVETILRNRTFALQYCEQSTYVPSSRSDLYNIEVPSKPVQQPFPGLFDQPSLAPFDPNPLGLGSDVFNNATRQQLKDTK
jgi:hypothetical protein